MLTQTLQGIPSGFFKSIIDPDVIVACDTNVFSTSIT